MSKVILDEIREILDELQIDPFATNANAIRQELGRGSNATIQKHLETIRQEIQKNREKEELDQVGQIPELPSNLAENIKIIWENAFLTANNQLQSKIQRLDTEKEQAMEQNFALHADIESLTNYSDTLQLEHDKLKEKNDTFEEVKINFQRQIDSLNENYNLLLRNKKDELNKKDEQILKLEKDKDDEIFNLQKQLDLKDKEFEIERKTLENQLQAFNNELSNLKSLLNYKEQIEVSYKQATEQKK